MIPFAKTLVCLSFLIVAVFMFQRRSIVSASAEPGEGASPRSLYVQNCATCHGSNGKAQTARGKKLEAADLTSTDVQEMSEAKIIRAITNGRPGMPSFKRKLTGKQISQVAAYVHTF